MLDQCLQKRRNVADDRLVIDIMLLGKLFENLADPARRGQHTPNFCRDAVEAEIGAGAYTQDNDAFLEGSRSRLIVPDENVVDRDVQSRQAPLRR